MRLVTGVAVRGGQSGGKSAFFDFIFTLMAELDGFQYRHNSKNAGEFSLEVRASGSHPLIQNRRVSTNKAYQSAKGQQENI